MDKILVLDDEKNILEVIKMRLEANGYQIFTALQVETAVEIAKKEEIDLALVDLKLTGKNGIEVMEELKMAVMGALGENNNNIIAKKKSN